MGYTQLSREAIYRLALKGVTPRDNAALLRNATSIQRIGEVLCSVDVGEKEQARLEKRLENALKRTEEIAAKYNAKNVASGDPRGSAIVLKFESGDEVHVTGRPFPPSVYDRW